MGARNTASTLDGPVLSDRGTWLTLKKDLGDLIIVEVVTSNPTLAGLGSMPDGICLDRDGAVWVASYGAGAFGRVTARSASGSA